MADDPDANDEFFTATSILRAVMSRLRVGHVGPRSLGLQSDTQTSRCKQLKVIGHSFTDAVFAFVVGYYHQGYGAAKATLYIRAAWPSQKDTQSTSTQDRQLVCNEVAWPFELPINIALRQQKPPASKLFQTHSAKVLPYNMAGKKPSAKREASHERPSDAEREKMFEEGREKRRQPNGRTRLTDERPSHTKEKPEPEHAPSTSTNGNKASQSITSSKPNTGTIP